MIRVKVLPFLNYFSKKPLKMGGIVGPKWPTPLAKRIRISDTPLPTFISSSLPFKSLKYASFCEKLPFLKENGHF